MQVVWQCGHMAVLTGKVCSSHVAQQEPQEHVSSCFVAQAPFKLTRLPKSPLYFNACHFNRRYPL
jgi:hypothetical protein